ncbi:LPS assembly lipoprotein LptE [Thiocapsa sp. UBA6158]|uniref:LPS-assembly lipoprotein LptE n=1 Tax=Thiocapsa sp. UBA6158 TaxID=1947692 RepID=UPI0025F47E62|nr:LPS assembly lipoprotein LptE [Thiocapsa sp. UBA6158]
MKRRVFLALIPALPLAGCGFHLRGSNAIPYRSIHVDAPRDSGAARQLASVLRSRGISLPENARDADAVLKLFEEKKTRSILSLSGGGRVREYRLNYSLSYSLAGKDGSEIFPAATIASSRDFTYDDNQYLAKTAEESFLYRDLQDDAVQQILRRLAK